VVLEKMRGGLRKNDKRVAELGPNGESFAVALGKKTVPKSDISMDELRMPTAIAENS
jgi:hypothetical protein